MIALSALALSAAATLSAPPALAAGELALAAVPACSERTRAAIVFSEDTEGSAREALEAELGRACFTLTEVVGADEAALLDAARVVPARWLLVTKATLVEAPSASYLPYTKMPSYSLTIDVTAFDVPSSQRRGRAMRNANVVASLDEAATTREATRVIADAVRVLGAQMKEAPAVVAVDRSELSAEPRSCSALKEVVVLWHKANDPSGKAAVLRALEGRCVKVVEQIEGERTQAMEWARELNVPLIAVRTTLQRLAGLPASGATGGAVSHKLAITVDLVDAQAEGLKILKHATDSRNALRASDDADAWKKVEGSLLAAVLDKALAPQ